MNRLYIILFFVFTLSSNAFSQQEESILDRKISINFYNISIKQAIVKLEKQTGISFAYNNSQVSKKFVNQSFKSESIKNILNKILKNQNLDYKIIDGKIIIYKSKNRKSKITVSGFVYDKETGETLIGCNIFDEETKNGTVSNNYGFYSLTLNDDGTKKNIVFSYIGYQTKTLEVSSTKTINIKLELKKDGLSEVVIIDDIKRSQVNNILTGVTSISRTEIKKLPSFLGVADITRVILTQPGITTVGEGSSGFNVRGGNIDQNLILLDEAPIYSSAHLWGLFSIINADAVKNMKLYKGGIPARYGGRASSVLDIRQREGGGNKFAAEGEIGLLMTGLTLDVPIVKDKLSLLVSGRRTYFDLFFPMFKATKGNDMHFYDLSTKIAWNINKNNRIFFSGYFGADIMKMKFDGYENADGSKTPATIIDFRWKNTTATVRWNHIFSDKLFMNISGVYSRYNYEFYSENDIGGGPANTEGTFTWKSSIDNYIFKPDFTLFINSKTKFRFGVASTFYLFNPAKIISNDKGINNIEFENEHSIESAAYIEFEKKWWKLSLNAGLRYSVFANIGPYTVAEYAPNYPINQNNIVSTKEYKSGEIIKSYNGFEPRLALKYALKKNIALKLGYNRMFQYIHLISNTSAALPFDIWKPAGAYIKPLKVDQLSIGYAQDTKNRKYSFSAESYYKLFADMLEYRNGADLFVNKNLETQLLPASGYAYGLELSLTKNYGIFSGNINYTYSVSKRKTTSKFNYENINNGEYYFSNYDRPHTLNINTNFTITKEWSASLFFTFQTGRPTTLPTGRIMINGQSYITYSDRNAYRISNTHRIDVSFTYTPISKKNIRLKSSISFGVYNVYAHDNAFSVYSTFDGSANGALSTYQFSVIGAPIPFVTYLFKF